LTDPVVVTVSDDATAKVWWLPAFSSSVNYKVQPTVTLRGHTAPVLCCALNADGELVATGSADNTIRVWRVPDEGIEFTEAYESLQEHCLKGHTMAVVSVAFVDSATLISASKDGTCRIWTLSDGGCCAEWQSPDNDGADPTSVSVLRDNSQQCVVTYDNGRAFVIDALTGTVVRPLVTETTDHPRSAITSASSRICTNTDTDTDTDADTTTTIATTHTDNTLRLYTKETGECVSAMVAHTEGVADVDFGTGQHNNYIVTCSTGRSIRIWDADTLRCCEDIAAHRQGEGESVTAVRWCARDLAFVSVGVDSVARVFAL
jgi:striatin 1/3/4